MQRSLLMIVALLLPAATSACSESCAQSRYGGKPTGTGTHFPTTGTGGLGGPQTQVPNLNGSLQGTRTLQLSPGAAGTGVAVAPDTSTNVIVKPPPPVEEPLSQERHGEENESENTTTCA